MVRDNKALVHRLRQNVFALARHLQLSPSELKRLAQYADELTTSAAAAVPPEDRLAERRRSLHDILLDPSAPRTGSNTPPRSVSPEITRPLSRPPPAHVCSSSKRQRGLGELPPASSLAASRAVSTARLSDFRPGSPRAQLAPRVEPEASRPGRSLQKSPPPRTTSLHASRPGTRPPTSGQPLSRSLAGIVTSPPSERATHLPALTGTSQRPHEVPPPTARAVSPLVSARPSGSIPPTTSHRRSLLEAYPSQPQQLQQRQQTVPALTAAGDRFHEFRLPVPRPSFEGYIGVGPTLEAYVVSGAARV